MKEQRVRDPIHNLIKFSEGTGIDSVLWNLVQTPEMQRTRRVRQLGFSDIVYPGATHSRFSHSLGTMQMSRKMLTILERNEALPEMDDHSLKKSATLCAALLHDIGHGPYSHVFEEVSKSRGIDIRHEAWTKKIINEGAVASVLSRYSEELLVCVRSFFERAPGFTPYTAIVSSQLDADRLDYLQRDRHFTGVGFGKIDVEWILDSLSIQKVPHKERPYQFVVSKKGLQTIEGYLLAYADMYTSIYFHKTTRAAQLMFEEILKRILADENALDAIPDHNPVKAYFSKTKNHTLEEYLALDDSVLTNLVSEIARIDGLSTSVLAKRWVNRELFKCFQVPRDSSRDDDPFLNTQFTDELKKQGVPYYEDQIRAKGYELFDAESENYILNILVESETARNPMAFYKVSDIAANLKSPPTTRYYFESEDERLKAQEIWRTL